MKDKFFTFYVFNTIQRHINNTQGNYFFGSEHFHGKEPPSIEDVEDAFRKGDTTYISKLQYFTQNIRGSDAFWRNKTKELEHWIMHHVTNGNGPPTFFITLSCAEYWWPDLRRLMSQLERNAGNDDQADLLMNNESSDERFNAMCVSVKRYPLYVNDFFMKRSKDFLGSVVTKALGIEHYWGRIEFAPGRGQIHIHLLAISKDKAYLKDYYTAKTDEEKARVVSDYAETMLDMTADVDADDSKEYRESRNESPLLKRYCECMYPDKDSADLAQACMMHHCNKGCMQCIRKDAPRLCKQGAGIENEIGSGDTPGFGLTEEPILLVDYKGIRHLHLRRLQSRRVLQHSRTFLKAWRANCDVKLILYESDPDRPNITEIDNVVRYLVAYTSKKSKTHSEEKTIIQDLITRSVRYRFLMGTVLFEFRHSQNPQSPDIQKCLSRGNWWAQDRHEEGTT